MILMVSNCHPLSKIIVRGTTAAGDDILPDELSDFSGCDRSHDFCFDAFCKVIYGDEEVLALSCGLRERPQYIHTPSGEGSALTMVVRGVVGSRWMGANF